MSTDVRKEVLAAVHEAAIALSQTWRLACVGSGLDPELERVVAGQVLSAESHLWDAVAALARLTKDEEMNA
jgi:hypothetical protein